MDKNIQKIEEIKGRPMLYWYGKKPLQTIEWFPAQEKEVYGDINSKDFNKLFWGDNLQVLSHLLKEYRGKVDLIYIDPPFDSKADYVKKVKLKGEKIEGQQQGLLEQKQYTDIWENDEYLQFMYERILVLRELISESGSLYLHCDYHKASFLKLIMDEIFGESNFLNEIIWSYSTQGRPEDKFARKHDNIFSYAKNITKYTFNAESIKVAYSEDYIKSHFRDKDEQGNVVRIRTEAGKTRVYYPDEGMIPNDVWTDVYYENPMAKVRTDYPTQKPEALLERIIKASSNEGDLILDCFCGSGTTLAVAQKLGRRWIGCDINLGAVQTTTKRLNQIIQEQSKEHNFAGSKSFKVLNVNEYDLFKNEMEAKEIIMDMYGIEPVKRSYFDGELDNKFVKVMPLNRVLNKLDITEVIKNIEKNIDTFTARKTSKAGEETYEEGVLVIGSGIESDVMDFIKKENKTHVKIEVRDIQSDKKNLIFKKPPEAQIEVTIDESTLKVEIKDFFSPLLIQKLQLENEKRLKEESITKIEDFKQIIESVTIDVNYDGKLFNAEIMDLPDKKSEIKAIYDYKYTTTGANTVAVKIIDVLGEEYFETFKVNVKGK